MSGVAGADRIKSRADFEHFIQDYKRLISLFPGFVSITPSGSYNSNPDKQDFGDIDLIVHIKSNLDKAQVKKQLQAFFMKEPETKIVPFSSEKHAGKRTYNAGELVSIRYHNDQLGYSAQIDNIIALDHDEAGFKQRFLDMPAEKQGLILGLVKVATIETDPAELFKSLGIQANTDLEPNQEYEFNLSSVKIELRLNTYEPGTYSIANKQVVWQSQNFNDLQKILYQYDLDQDFTGLLAQVKSKIRNPRSGQRIKGVFASMITVKSGEVGTAKGAGKEAALNKIDQTLGESRSLFRSLVEADQNRKIVFAFVRFQPPTVGHELLITAVKKVAAENHCPYVIYVSRTQGKTSAPRLKDPLSIEQKMGYLNKIFPGTNFVAADDHTRTPVEAAAALNKKYTDLIVVAGADRAGLKDTLEQFNGIEYNFNSINFVSAGDRDPDSEGVAGVSGTDVRTAANNNDFATFKKNLPSGVDNTTAQQLMKDLQAGMAPVPRKKPVRKAKENRDQQGSDVVWKQGAESPGYPQTYHNTGATGSVAEGVETITELRDRLFQYVKSLLPTWPDYVLKDWLVPNKGDFSNLPADTLKNGIMQKLQGEGLTVNTKWQLVPNMKFTMDMWNPTTREQLIARAGGKSTELVPSTMSPSMKDAERHATQARLAQQQGGVRKEPVIITKTTQGWDLIEGWHRTIQHFAQYPEGYTGPAYVAVAQGQQSVAEAGMPDVNLAYQDFQQMPNGRFEKEYGMTKQDWKAQYARVLNPPKPFADWDNDDLNTAEIEKPSARTKTAQQWGVNTVPRGVPTMGSQQPSSGMYVFHSKSIGRGGGSFTDQQLVSFGLSKTRNGNWVYRPQPRMSPDDVQRKVRELTRRLNAKPYYYNPNNTNEDLQPQTATSGSNVFKSMSQQLMAIGDQADKVKQANPEDIKNAIKEKLTSINDPKLTKVTTTFLKKAIDFNKNKPGTVQAIFGFVFAVLARVVLGTSHVMGLTPNQAALILETTLPVLASFIFLLIQGQSIKNAIKGGLMSASANVAGVATANTVASTFEEAKTKQRLDPKCWKGYRKAGTKLKSQGKGKGKIRVNKCVPVSEEIEDIMAGLISIIESKHG
jgi:hypothetical protein